MQSKELGRKTRGIDKKKMALFSQMVPPEFLVYLCILFTYFCLRRSVAVGFFVSRHEVLITNKT